MNTSTVVPWEKLPSFIQLAHTHPSPELRDQLRQELEAWIVTLRPPASFEAMRDLIAAERGTLFEPFTLEGAELDIAADASRIALAGLVGGQAFRLVSTETLGNRGGLELGPTLEAAVYRERYAFGVHRADSESSYFYAPTLAPSARAIAAALVPGEDAKLKVTKKGLSLRVPELDKLVPAWDEDFRIAGKLSKASFCDSAKGAKRLDLSYKLEASDLAVTASSPEAMILFMSASLSESVFTLAASTEGGARITVRLANPASPEAARLRYLVDLDPAEQASWFSLPPPGKELPSLLRSEAFPPL